jgi:DNA polymerase-4
MRAGSAQPTGGRLHNPAQKRLVKVIVRRILHIDMDAFFAAVELLRHPELRGKPVIVGGRGDPHARGVVSTASYEARRFGIHSGMPLRTACQHCPEATFLPVDYPEYARISRQIKAILHRFSPVLEDVGIDEAFLDISAAREDPRAIAQAIKSSLRKHTGLTCSIGIAPNKLLAKLASDMDKPNGLTVLSADELKRRVWPLPVRKLWGVGVKTEAKLANLGVTTVGELASLREETLIAHFGTAQGRYLHRAARGIDERPLVTHWEPKSFSHETTFQRDTGDWTTIEAVLRTLTEELVARLRDGGYRASSVTVKLRYANFETHTRSLRLPAATDDLAAIHDAAQRCLHQFALEKPVRLVGIRLGDLR